MSLVSSGVQPHYTGTVDIIIFLQKMTTDLCTNFGKSMSRDNFWQIKQFLHIADSNKLLLTKVAKALPPVDKLRANCQQFGVLHQFLSIDESMVPYRSHHSAQNISKVNLPSLGMVQAMEALQH